MKEFSEYTTPRPGHGGFPIPDFIRDLFNKIFRKEQSLYTRRETPSLVIPEYGDFSYRNVPIKLLTRLIIVYDDPVMPVEVHTVHRSVPSGNILKVTKILTNKTLVDLGVTEPDDSFDGGNSLSYPVIDDPNNMDEPSVPDYPSTSYTPQIVSGQSLTLSVNNPMTPYQVQGVNTSITY